MTQPHYTDPATGRPYTVDPVSGQARWLDQYPPAPPAPAKRRHPVLITLGVLVAGIIGLSAIGAAMSGGGTTGGAGVSGAAASTAPAGKTAASPRTQGQAQGGSVSQQNALRAAQNYIAMKGFSRKGLIQQLSAKAGDGYPVADATWAVDHLGANWNEQAVRAGKDYLSMQGFSRAGLIQQLSSPYGDQFTRAQAAYAASQLGLK